MNTFAKNIDQFQKEDSSQTLAELNEFLSKLGYLL
jgi:hypothetical protein